MAMQFDRKEYYGGFEYRFSVYNPKDLEYEVWVVVVFDLGDVTEERKYTLKQKHFASVEEAVNAVIVFAKSAIDEFKKQRGMG